VGGCPKKNANCCLLKDVGKGKLGKKRGKIGNAGTRYREDLWRKSATPPPQRGCCGGSMSAEYFYARKTLRRLKNIFLGKKQPGFVKRDQQKKGR